MNRALLSLVVTLLAATATAQGASVVAPQAYTMQLENDWVRVTRVHYAPHEKLTEHSHPSRPSIYIYLKDGGPVLFKHEHGDSNAMAAIRPDTKAGSYRIALGRNETHIVDNQSDLSSDFLQVELKTAIDPKTFNGRRNTDPANAGRNSSTVEFDTPQVRITRVSCADASACQTAAGSLEYSALQVSFSTGATTWLAPHAANVARAPGEYLFVEMKSKP